MDEQFLFQEIKATGMAHFGRSIIGAARGSEDKQAESTQQPEPTGPGLPVVARLPPEVDETDEDTDRVTKLPTRTSQLPAAARASRTDSLRKQAFGILERDPELSVNQLAKALGCRWGRADLLKREWMRSQQSGKLAL